MGKSLFPEHEDLIKLDGDPQKLSDYVRDRCNQQFPQEYNSLLVAHLINSFIQVVYYFCIPAIHSTGINLKYAIALQVDPKRRMSVAEALNHPALWSDKYHLVMKFVKRVSDRGVTGLYKQLE
jgi:hypothetical protein